MSLTTPMRMPDNRGFERMFFEAFLSYPCTKRVCRRMGHRRPELAEFRYRGLNHERADAALDATQDTGESAADILADDADSRSIDARLLCEQIDPAARVDDVLAINVPVFIRNRVIFADSPGVGANLWRVDQHDDVTLRRQLSRFIDL